MRDANSKPNNGSLDTAYDVDEGFDELKRIGELRGPNSLEFTPNREHDPNLLINRDYTPLNVELDEPPLDPTPQEMYLRFHQTLCDQSRELSRLKQNDYCDLSSDELFSVFGNFMNSEKFGVCSTDIALMSRFVDKLSRLITVIGKDGDCDISDESEMDTLQDMINFLCLIAYYRSLNKMN